MKNTNKILITILFSIITVSLHAQLNTNTRQIKFNPVQNATDTTSGEGKVWYDFATGELRLRNATGNISLGAGGGGSAYTAGDGLTLTGNEFKLGGLFNDAVSIVGNADFAITTNYSSGNYSQIIMNEDGFSVSSSTATNGISYFQDLNTLKGTFIGKHEFTPTSTNASLNAGSLAGNPSSLSNGDLWYNSTTGKFMGRQGGSTINLGLTNSAANNELMKSNGTDAVSSNVILDASGNITFGSPSASGGRNITVNSSSTNANLTLQAKGNGGVFLGDVDSRIGVNSNANDNILIEGLATTSIIRDGLPNSATINEVLSIVPIATGTEPVGFGGMISFHLGGEGTIPHSSINTILTDNTDSNQQKADISFSTRFNTALNEQFRIKSNGDVVINNLRTNCTGASTGTLWSDGGTLKVCP